MNFSILIDGKHEAQFLIKRLSSKEVGIYECIGTNSGGAESVKFVVSLKQKAEIVKFDKVDDKIQTLTISCTVRGQPLPNITLGDTKRILSSTKEIGGAEISSRPAKSILYLNESGKEMKQMDQKKLFNLKIPYYSRLTKIDDSSIMFDVIFKDKKSVNANTFVCSTENSHGKDMKQIEVASNKDPKFSDGRHEIYQTVEFNEPLDLKCEVEGFPKPSINWMFVSNMNV